MVSCAFSIGPQPYLAVAFAESFVPAEEDMIGEKFSISLFYDPKADKASWEELEKFLTALFAPPEEETGDTGKDKEN